MYTCHVCGKPTPNYHEWWPSVAAILGEQGESTCDECLRKAQISYKRRNEQCAEGWRMSCYFCGGSHIASIHSAPDRGGCNWSVGSMTLMRRYDGEPIVRVELDTSVMLDVSVNGSCGDCVSADVTADAYIEDIKYCPFCGEEL